MSILLELYSRRIVGWSYRRTMHEELVIDSLQKAVGLRQMSPGLIHHTDRGGQYASRRYRSILRRASMRQSMSAKHVGSRQRLRQRLHGVMLRHVEN